VDSPARRPDRAFRAETRKRWRGALSTASRSPVVSLLYAASGLGLLLGFALLISRSTRFPAVTVTIAGFVISSAGNLLTGLSSVIAAAFAMQLVRGVGISLVEVGLTTLVQRTVPPVSSHRADGGSQSSPRGTFRPEQSTIRQWSCLQIDHVVT
jgi:hypothetical protein